MSLSFTVGGTKGTFEDRFADEVAGLLDNAFGAEGDWEGVPPRHYGELVGNGWGDLQQELTALSKAGRWAEMAGLIDDDMLGTFAVVAEPGDVAAAVRQRFGGVFTRLHLYVKPPLDAATMWPIVAELADG